VSLTHPAEIEREIQRQIAAASASRTKASLFNLVIFRRAFSLDPSAEALDYLLGRRPARLILVESGVDSPSEAFVSARCHPEPTSLELCFQEIRIQDGPDGVGRDPGFWSPLLIRDIPVILWWLEGMDRLPELLPGLAPVTDRLTGYGTFAEGRGEDPFGVLGRLAVEVSEAGIPCSDFSWRRIQPLRLNTARLFDPPGSRELLGEIRSVRLRGGARVEFLLYLFGIAARLGWAPRLRRRGTRAGAGEEALGMTDASGSEVQVTHESPGPLEAGVGVRIEVADGRGLEFECRGGERSRPGCGQLSGPDGRKEFVSFSIPTAGEILLREVDSHAPDPIFRDVLALFAAASQRGKQ
jgi:hypothetical protein